MDMKKSLININSIEASKAVRKENLNKENFFLSLLRKLWSAGLLNEAQLQNIQLQILDIFKEHSYSYTKGKSGSLKIEVGESILLSIYYTIGTYLKNVDNIIESVEMLKNKGVKEIYKEGENLIEDKVCRSKVLLALVKESMIKTENYAYNDTISYGIPLFFKEYNIEFEAHNSPGSIDYPLFEDKMDLIGVEYIHNYLKKLLIENRFCKMFNELQIEELLKSYHKKCEELLINIFRMVLTNTLGSILVGKSGRNLSLTSQDISYIEGMFKLKNDGELNDIMVNCLAKLIYELEIMDEELVYYLRDACREITMDIKRGLEINKASCIFIEAKGSLHKKSFYTDNKSVSNSEFCNITEEIRACTKVEDKMKIIQEDIHSLEDLVDVLDAHCIFEDEFEYIFKNLTCAEIALILNYIGIDLEDMFNDFNSLWHEKIYDYINQLSPTEKRAILELKEQIA